MPAQTQLTPDWKSLEGTILEGGYEMEQCLNAASQTALFKLRILGDRFTSASVKVWAPGVLSPGQTLQLQEISQLRHPGLSHPLSAGMIGLNGAHFPFLVLKTPDETLEGALQERALTPGETRQVVSSLAEVLGFLHRDGYVHGAVSPETIFANGETIQLSASSLHPIDAPLRSGTEPARYTAPEGSPGNNTRAADVYCLGATVYEVLTRRRWTADSRTEISSLPAPFRLLVLQATEEDTGKRAYLADIRAILAGVFRESSYETVSITTPAETTVAGNPPAMEERIPEATPYGSGPVTEATRATLLAEVAPAVPTPSVAKVPNGGSNGRPAFSARPNLPVVPPTRPAEAGAAGASAFRRVPVLQPDAGSAAPAPGPSLFSSYSGRASRRLDGEDLTVERSAPWRKPVLAAGTVLTVAFAGWLLRPHAAVPVTAAATKALQSHVVTPTEGTAPPAPVPATPAVPLALPAPQVESSRAARGDVVWRVVAFTFNRKEDAERRANMLRAKHPNLKPEVFSPSGASAPYLVVVGGRMNRRDAVRLRSRARSAGLPRDSYIQNYGR